MKNGPKADLLLTATGGMVTAVSFVICLAGGAVAFTKILFPAVCGILLAVVMRYVSLSVAILSYVATSVLLLLFSPDKLTALAYVCLLGYYPMVFRFLAEIRSVIMRALLKAGLLALVGFGLMLAGTELLGIAENEAFKKYGWLLGFCCCIFFVLYDRLIFVIFQNMEGIWDEKLKNFFRRFR